MISCIFNTIIFQKGWCHFFVCRLLQSKIEISILSQCKNSSEYKIDKSHNFFHDNSSICDFWKDLLIFRFNRCDCAFVIKRSNASLLIVKPWINRHCHWSKLKYLFQNSHLSFLPSNHAWVTLQSFITLIGPEALSICCWARQSLATYNQSPSKQCWARRSQAAYTRNHS